MAFDIAELVRQHLTPQVLGRLGPGLGVSPDAIQKASDVALPPVLAGIARQGSTEAGAHTLLDASVRDGIEPARFAETLGDPLGTEILRSKGSAFLSSIFGMRLDTLTNFVGSQSGIGTGAAKGLLASLAPLALGVLDKHVRAQGLDARGLSAWLSEQQGVLGKGVPPGLASTLGVGGLHETLPERPAVAASPTEPMHHATRDTRIGIPDMHRRAIPPPQKKTGLGWLVPVLGLLVVAFLGYRALKPRAERAAREERPTATAPVAARAPTGTAAVAELERFVSSTGSVKAVPKAFNLGALAFAEGTSDLTTASRPTVEQLAKVLDEHDNVAVRLEGHTAPTGDARQNEQLSRARAESVRRELLKRGVSPERVEVAGIGGTRPIVPGDSPQAQQQNARIELIVTEM